MNPRPGGLTAVLVISIVLGGMGILGSCGEAVNLFINPALFSTFSSLTPQPAPGANKTQGQPFASPDGILKAQQAVLQRWRTVLVLTMILGLLLSLLLLAGGVGGMSRKTWSRKFLMAAFITGIVVEAVRLVPAVMFQYETVEANRRYVEQEIGKLPPASRRAPADTVLRSTEAAMAVVGTLGLVTTSVWKLAEIGFFLFGIHYLKRPRTVNFLAGQDDDEPMTAELVDQPPPGA